MFSDELNKKNSDIHKKDIDRLVDDLLKSKNSAPLSKKCCYDSVSKMKFRDFFYCFDRSKIKKFGSLLLFFLLLTNLLGSASSFVESNSDTVVKGVSELENSTMNITSNESIDSNLNSQNSIQNISTKKVVFENSSDNKSLEPSDEYILKDSVYGDQNENQTETETNNSLNNTQNNKFNESIFQNSTENEEYLPNEYNNTKEPISCPVSSNNLNDTLDPTSSLISLCKYNYNKSDNPLTISYNKFLDSINSSGIENIMLYYSYSIDNISWSKKYLFDSIFYDSNKTNWKFTFPNGSGYYRFFSIAVDNKGNCENKDSYDIECFYNTIKENNFSNNTGDDLSNNSRNDGLVIPDFVNDKFERGENVRVIIKLADLGGEGHLSENSFSLEKTGFIKKAHISSENLLAGVVNKSSFEKIKDEINIDSIYYDESFSVLLKESLPLVGFNKTYEEYGLTGKNIKICILDTGVNRNIVDIAGGYDFVNDDPIPEDGHGHGTQIASIIKTIAPDCELYTAKVIDSDGTGYESDVLEGLEWCINQNPDIISFSIGTTDACDGFCDENLVTSMCNDAWKNNGIFISAAAGNQGETGLVSPACAKNVFSVGSTDNNDNIAGFSNTHFMLDCFAPGDDINTITGTGSGTSFSTAIVAGTAGLILENESLTPDDLKNQLKCTGQPIPYSHNDNLTINISRINIYNAIKKNKTMNPYNYNQDTINETDNINDSNYTVLKYTTWHFPDSEGDTYSEWMNPTNAYTNDTNYALGRDGSVYGEQDYYGFDLVGINFGQVMSTADVDGIIVEIEAEGQSTTADIDVELTFDDFSSMTSTGYSNTYADGVSSIYQYGGSSNTWGETGLTGKDLADNKFRVYCNVNGGTGRIARTYYVKVKVYHSTNTNPDASYDSGAQDTYGGKSVNTFSTYHTDSDGQSDVDDCRIRIGTENGDNFTIAYNPDNDTTWIVDGNDWVSSVSATNQSITDGYNITWTFTPDWDFPYDDSDFDVAAYTIDSSGADSGYNWSEAGTTTHENDLIIYSIKEYTLSNSDYSEDGDTTLTEDEWFRGGVQVRCEGTVTYEGTTNVYPPTTALDVHFWADGIDTGEDYDCDTLGSNGAFQTTYYTTTDAEGIESDYDFNVSLAEFTTSAGQGTGGANTLINASRDNQIPTSSIDSICPYEQTSSLLTLNGTASDNSGVGIKDVTLWYRYSSDNESWGSWIEKETDSDGPLWQWNFNFTNTNNAGYYEFFSIANDDVGNQEDSPPSADTSCYYIENISISVTPAGYDFGTVDIGSNNYSTSGQFFTLTNNGNVAIDVLIKGDNATNSSSGAEWKLSNTQSYDNFSMKYKKDGDESWGYINTSYDNFLTSLSASGSKTFDLNLFMATTSSTVDPLEFDITLKSVAS